MPLLRSSGSFDVPLLESFRPDGAALLNTGALNGARTFQSAAILENSTASKNTATIVFLHRCGLESPRSVLESAVWPQKRKSNCRRNRNQRLECLQRRQRI